VVVPAGYRLDSVPRTDSSGRGWSVDATTAGQLLFTAGKKGTPVPPGGTVSFALALTPVKVQGTYCYAGSTPWTWSARAKQANDFSGTGNDFVDLQDPMLRVASLVYATAPQTTNVGAAISYSPGVQISVIDGCGTIAGDATGSVSMAIGQNPSTPPGNLGGTTSQALVAGVATFPDLTIDSAGTGYTLVGTPASGSSIGNLDAVESASFAIASVCTTADNGAGCHTSNGGTGLTVSLPPSGDTTQLSLGPLDTTSTCGGKSSIGSLATVAPHFANPGMVFVTLVYAAGLAKQPGTNGYLSCLTKPDGTVIQLLNCTGNNPAPCVDSKQHPGGGTLTIVLKLNSDDPVGGTYR
jgi:hypothetical protein